MMSVSEAALRVGAQTTIALRVFQPLVVAPWAVCVFAHGGCFSDGDCTSQPDIPTALASIGIASVSSSYRQGAAHPHPTAAEDLLAVARFTRERFNLPNLPLGIVGSSSGGWHALALSRDTKDFSFCVALCPVAHPGRRAAYLRRCVAGTAGGEYRHTHTKETAANMLSKQLGYWRTDEAMEAAGEGLATPSPVPTLVVVGSADMNIPPQVTADVQSWATRTVCLGGYGHEIQSAPPEGADSWVPDVERFVRGAVDRAGK